MKTLLIILLVLSFSVVDCMARDWKKDYVGNQQSITLADNGTFAYVEQDKGRSTSKVIRIALSIATPIIVSTLAYKGNRDNAITTGVAGGVAITAFKLLEVQHTFNVGGRGGN